VVNIAWIPCNLELSGNQLFDLDAARDCAIERFVKAHDLLSQHGFYSNTIDLCDLTKVDVVIFYGFSTELRWLIQAIKGNPDVRLINIPIEPPVVSALHSESILPLMPFDRILVWNDNLAARGLPFIKANIGEAVIVNDSIPEVSFQEKKFMVAITSSKRIKHKNGIHQERFNAFDFFSKKPEGMDLYGVGWDKTSYPFVKTSYRGLCDTKKDILQHYKFSICFENAKNYPGLITEKIFDCFAAGVVPIYYGAPNVKAYIPNSCFINFLDFSDYDELYDFLVSMDEGEYQSYLDAVKAFIQTPEYYEFTSKRFAEVVLEQVQSLMREDAPHRTVLGFKWSLLKVVLQHPLFFLRNMKQCRRFLFDLFVCF